MSNPASGTAAALKAVATGQQTPEQGRNPYERLKNQLEQSRGEFAKLVGGDKNADKFIRVVLNAVLNNPALLDVTRSSLIGACMRAAQDGLMPDGREAVLNIYTTKNRATNNWEPTAQYLPMVGGLIKKLYAAEAITYVDAAVVYRGDVFKFQRGDEPKLIHEPAIDYREEDLDKGEPVIIAAYAIVKLRNGETKREVMPRRDIDKVRAASKAADSGPWKTWFSEMSIKSVLKRIYKQLPHTDAFDAIETYDNIAMGYTGITTSAADIARPAAPPAPAQAALSNEPSDALQPSLQPQQQEPVEQQDTQGGDVNTLRTRDGAEEVGGDQGEKSDAELFTGPTAAELIERIQGAGDVSIAELVLDESRSLPEPSDRALVQDAFDAKWPSSKPAPKAKK